MAPKEEWPEVIPITEATQQFMSPNPSETMRIDFTDFFLRFRHADDAHPLYKHIFVLSQQLIKLLVEHPAMKPNLEQTFSTPANSKNKVYFMWDFVLRTFQFQAALCDPRKPWDRSSEAWADVMSRTVMAGQLIRDTTGQLEQMNAGVGYKDDGGVEFTDEIKEVVNKMATFPIYCEGCGKSERDDGQALLACAKCKKERYCSTECQRKCWKHHKKNCTPP